jgi:hypothetical protein
MMTIAYPFNYIILAKQSSRTGADLLICEDSCGVARLVERNLAPVLGCLGVTFWHHRAAGPVGMNE